MVTEPSNFDWLTLFAIFAGPIFAVIATRIIDSRRERRERRLGLFKTLMRTRGARLNQDHVGALNLIEIEYYKEQRVLTALEKYMQHLNDRRSNQTHTDVEIWLKNSDHLFTKLMYEVAKSLGYEIEQLQILTGGYSPQGWAEVEERGANIQKKLLAFLNGEIPLPIRGTVSGSTNFEVPPNFPPPPA